MYEDRAKRMREAVRALFGRKPPRPERAPQVEAARRESALKLAAYRAAMA